MKEILTKFGVEIIIEVFDLLIRQSFHQGRINMDLMEIKTINLCFRYFNEILNKDIQAFNDIEHAIRIKLLKQISRIMDLSLEIMPKLKDRELVNQKLNENAEIRGEGFKEVVNANAIFDPLF
jgi:hypothetical protein